MMVTGVGGFECWIQWGSGLAAAVEWVSRGRSWQQRRDYGWSCEYAHALAGRSLRQRGPEAAVRGMGCGACV